MAAQGPPGGPATAPRGLAVTREEVSGAVVAKADLEQAICETERRMAAVARSEANHAETAALHRVLADTHDQLARAARRLDVMSEQQLEYFAALDNSVRGRLTEAGTEAAAAFESLSGQLVAIQTQAEGTVRRLKAQVIVLDKQIGEAELPHEELQSTDECRRRRKELVAMVGHLEQMAEWLQKVPDGVRGIREHCAEPPRAPPQQHQQQQ